MESLCPAYYASDNKLDIVNGLRDQNICLFIARVIIYFDSRVIQPSKKWDIRSMKRLSMVPMNA